MHTLLPALFLHGPPGTANSGGSSGPASGSHALPDSHPAPPPTSAGNKWRQTVMHAKRTAFLAVNTANALMGVSMECVVCRDSASAGG